MSGIFDHTNYVAEDFGLKIAMRLQGGEGDGIPHGELKRYVDTKEHYATFQPKHIVRVKILPNKGPNDKAGSRSVFITFSPSLTCRGKTYESKEAEDTIRFLKDTFYPNMVKLIGGKARELGVVPFKPGDKIYRKGGEGGQGEGKIRRNPLAYDEKTGEYGMFASIRTEAFMDKKTKKPLASGFGKFLVRRTVKDAQGVATPVPVDNVFEKPFILYGILHGMTFEVRVKDGLLSISALLSGIDLIDADKMSNEAQDTAAALAAEFATDDLDDVFADDGATSAQPSLAGDAPHISATFGAGLKLEDPESMIAD